MEKHLSAPVRAHRWWWGRRPSALLVLALMLMAAGGAAQDEPLLIELPTGALPGDVSGSGFTVVGSLLGGGSDPQLDG